jgi:DNA-3-methyladenine glycosylase
VRQFRLREDRLRERRAAPRARADPRIGCDAPAAWPAGKLCEALAITHVHNALPLDAPPIALHARTETPEIVSGVRIGITKAAELPWRYGLKGSRFLSKPFAGR